MIPSFQFQSPWWLLCLALFPVLSWLRARRPVKALVVPMASGWMRSSMASLPRLAVAFFYVAIGLVVVALARPQRMDQAKEDRREGYDILLAIDLSGSMLAEDYEKGGRRINRMEAIRPVIEAFIDKRADDRIGIVVFAGRAYTMSPLTFDHRWLRQQFERIQVGLLEDGTAIGDGLGVGLARLEQPRLQQEGRRLGAFVILLTDGANNRGAIPPLEAAELAKARGVPVYTIGAGKEGMVPVPVFDEAGNKRGYRNMRSEIDEPTLRKIAAITGGTYFRATDSRTVQNAFETIDRAQKIEFSHRQTKWTEELFVWPLLPGCLCACVGLVLWRAKSKQEVG